jgi:hypothetical protein
VGFSSVDKPRVSYNPGRVATCSFIFVVLNCPSVRFFHQKRSVSEEPPHDDARYKALLRGMNR